MDQSGLEPEAPALQRRCSTAELLALFILGKLTT